MKKKNLIISLLTLGGMLLSSCMLAREKQDLVWSKWYDNGDGTHTRHNLNDISQTETDVHHFVLTSSLEEPTEVTPGKAIYTCEQCACKEEKVVPPTGNYVFNQKVVDDKYLLERYSEHSACYYMSSIEGAFGDPRYVFEVSDVPTGYTEVDYVESDGRQWVDTGVKNNGVNRVNINNGSRLGMDYTELEYIESTGTQFLKTGVKGPAKWTITIEFTQFGTRQLMGYNGNGANYWGVAEQSDYRGTEEGDYETYTAWEGHFKAGNKDVIVDDVGDTIDGAISRYLNGALVYSGAISGNLSTVDYELLALDNGQALCYSKLYSVKAEKNGIVTNEFIPAKRNSDGAVGLFDIVTYNFLENKGTGAFEHGAEVNNIKEELPEEYQELEYIEATGTQTIDLNTPFDLEHGSFEIDFQSTVLNQTGMIIGNYFGDYNVNYIWLYHYDLGPHTLTIYLNGNGNGNPQYQQNLSNPETPLDIAKHNAIYKNKTYILDGVEKGTAIGTLGVCDNLYLFSSGSGYNYQGKVFNLKINNGDGLVRNLVPCYRVSDGISGMYDLISNQFFTNSGTGEFVRGPEVEKVKPQLPLEYQQVEYVRSDGNQWINANVIFNNGDTAAQIVDVQLLDTSMHWCGANWYLQYGFSADYVNTHERVTLQQQFANKTLTTIVNGVAKTPLNITSTIPENIGTGVFRLMNNNGKWYDNKDTTTDDPSSQILYGLKIYKNNVLERDFVPCYKKANDEVGLFDMVSGSFFANEGTSPLLKGDPVNALDDSRDYNALEEANIPDYYYQLNFIESNGLQSLDTGVVGGAKIEATIKFARNSSLQVMGYSFTDGHLFGVGTNNKYLGSEIEAGNIDKIVVDIANTSPNKASLKINDEEPFNFDIEELDNSTLKLFSIGITSYKCIALMYSTKIYQGDELVRNFVPVMQKQTGAVGLYDLVNQRFYESTTSYPFEAGGIMYSGINTENINVFCNLNSNKAHPHSTKISSYKIYERNVVVRDFVSVIRNSDGVAGLYDLKNNEFYTSNSEFPLIYGKIIGHKLDEGTVTRKATHNQNGEIVYKCVYTNEEIHVSTDCTAYKVTFISDNGNLSSVKIFNNNDPNNYQMSMVGYTRNPNTFNYSKSGAYIHFEIPDDGHNYIVTASSGKVVKVKETDRQYKITGISSDVFVQLKLNDIHA